MISGRSFMCLPATCSDSSRPSPLSASEARTPKSEAGGGRSFARVSRLAGRGPGVPAGARGVAASGAAEETRAWAAARRRTRTQPPAPPGCVAASASESTRRSRVGSCVSAFIAADMRGEGTHKRARETWPHGNMATTQALRDFCTSAREGEIIRARRKAEKQQAQEARKAAEQVLLETLGPGQRARFSAGSEHYVVATKERRTYSSVTSGVVDRLGALWEDPEALKRAITDGDGGDIVENAAAVLSLAGTGVPRVRLYLEMGKLKNAADQELEEMAPARRELAETLMRAKCELQRGSEEHREELKRLQGQRTAAEELLVQELSVQTDQMRRVNLVETDGTAQSYFLRVKPPKAAPKKKVTPKCLTANIKELLSLEIDTLRVEASLQRLCSDDFRERFLRELRERLRAHELSGDAGERAPRIALDRVRMPSSQQLPAADQ